MSLSDVKNKLGLSDQDNDPFVARTISLIEAIYSIPRGKDFLEKIVQSTDNFRIEYRQNDVGEEPEPDSQTGEKTQVIYIDYDYVKNLRFIDDQGVAVVGEDITLGGRTVNSSEIRLLIHELNHGLIDADGDPRERPKQLDSNTQLGPNVQIANDILADTGAAVRPSYTAMTSPQNPTKIELGKDYTPGRMADVVYIDNLDEDINLDLTRDGFNNPDGTPSSYLVVLGDSANTVTGGASFDYIYGQGGKDIFYSSAGDDFLDVVICQTTSCFVHKGVPLTLDSPRVSKERHDHDSRESPSRSEALRAPMHQRCQTNN